MDFSTDIKLFKNPANGFDTYANYAVFLCANCVAYLKDCEVWAIDSRKSRWIELVNLLEDWHTERPEEMKPILTISLQESEAYRPFPTVLYGNGPAGETDVKLLFGLWTGLTTLVSGNQLYHTAMLLMLQERPGNIQLPRKLVSQLSLTSSFVPDNDLVHFDI